MPKHGGFEKHSACASFAFGTLELLEFYMSLRAFPRLRSVHDTASRVHPTFGTFHVGKAWGPMKSILFEVVAKKMLAGSSPAMTN
jgi:hypothetical protein